MPNATLTELLENATCGFAAGFGAGALVSGFELTKVKMQSNKNFKLTNMLTRGFIQDNWKLFMHTTPTFGLFFGGACAIEFSTNSALEKEYGKVAGLTASAINCAGFLTAADHFMFRKDKGIGYFDSMRYFSSRNNFRKLFTGFTPMVGREFLFGLSMLYTGPLLGDYIKKQRGGTDDKLLDLMWRFTGIFLSAIITTAMSQPLDSLAREMQKIHFASDGQFSPRFFDVAKNNLNIATLYRASTPRLVLASLGGATAGTLYKLFKGPQPQEALEQHQQKTQP